MDRAQPFKQLRWVLLVIGALLIAGGAYLMLRGSEPQSAQTAIRPKLSIYKDSKFDVQFKYDSRALAAKPLTDQDKTDQVLVRFSGTKQSMILKLSYQDGLASASGFLKKEPIEIIIDDIKTFLPQQYPGYKKISESRADKGTSDGVEVIFSYTGNNSEAIKQRLGIYIKDKDTAIYLSAQAKEAEFTALNRKIFEPSFSSLKL